MCVCAVRGHEWGRDAERRHQLASNIKKVEVSISSNPGAARIMRGESKGPSQTGRPSPGPGPLPKGGTFPWPWNYFASRTPVRLRMPCKGWFRPLCLEELMMNH